MILGLLKKKIIITFQKRSYLLAILERSKNIFRFIIKKIVYILKPGKDLIKHVVKYM